MMIRIIVWLLFAILAALLLYILLLAASALFVNPSREYQIHSQYYRWLLNSSTGIMLFFGRIHLHAEGMEKLPKDGRFLLVCNHRSKLDPITTWYLFRDYDLAFISKDENFYVPIWGRIIRRCCFLSIDRENPRNALVTIEHAAELIQNDQVSVAVYPEGTRNLGAGLLPFHNGVFKIAQKAGVPVVIAGIKGTEQIHRNFPLHRSDVYLGILDVIPAEKAASSHSRELGDLAAKEISSYIEEEREAEP